MKKSRQEKINKLLYLLGIKNLSKDKLNLINVALTHRSYYKDKENVDPNLYNQRLEFLGDAIIGLVISEYLYMKYQKEKEGELTKLKSYLVSQESLCNLAKEINLENYILTDEKIEKNHPKILTDAFEALIGAIFLITNLAKVRKILVNLIKDKEIIKGDYKSDLQEYIQQEYKQLPNYVLVKEEGLPHKKIFHVIVKLDRKKLGEGKGSSKKEAEINAAYNALLRLGKLSGLLKN